MYVLEVNNILDSRKNMENLFMCINQAKVDDMIIEDISPEYNYNNASSFSVSFEEENAKLTLNKYGPIAHLQLRYHIDEDMDICQRLILISSVP